MTADKARGPRIHRPAASARWEYEHRWGSQFGDSTTLSVIRTDGGSISIRYGKDSFEVRSDLVAVFAEMVQQAAEWTDEEVPR